MRFHIYSPYVLQRFPLSVLLNALLGVRLTGRPVVLAVSTNDALAGAAENIGRLLNRRHIYFVPFTQDDPIEKPNSMVADFSSIPKALEAALEHRQLQPGHPHAHQLAEAIATKRNGSHHRQVKGCFLHFGQHT